MYRLDFMGEMVIVIRIKVVWKIFLEKLLVMLDIQEFKDSKIVVFRGRLILGMVDVQLEEFW